MKTDTGENNESSSSVGGYQDLWVLNFMNKRQNRYMERIQDFFILDRFNLQGLSDKVENYEDAYLAILDQKPSKSYETEEKVYLLAHQRYIFTKIGADNVLDRVLNKEYGTCPRFGCENAVLIPVGLSNDIGQHETMVYCYNCVNLYEPKGSLKKLDGCAWGIGFPHFLVLSYPYHFEKKPYQPYVPRLFGFKISEPKDNKEAI